MDTKTMYTVLVLAALGGCAAGSGSQDTGDTADSTPNVGELFVSGLADSVPFRFTNGGVPGSGSSITGNEGCAGTYDAIGTTFYADPPNESAMVFQLGFHRCFETEPTPCDLVSWLETPATYPLAEGSRQGASVGYFNYPNPDGGTFFGGNQTPGTLTLTGSERIDSAIVIEGTFEAEAVDPGYNASQSVTEGAFRIWLGSCR